MLPAHQRFDRANTSGHQVVNRLVEHPQLVLLDRLTQLAGQLHPLLGLGGQLFGVQRKPFAAIALGLEQRRISIAQQLLGSQRITGKQADTDTGTHEQLMPGNRVRRFESIDHLLRERCGMNHVRTVFDQQCEFITAQPRDRHAAVGQRIETFGSRLEHFVADVMAKAVVDVSEVVQVHHQQRTAAPAGARRGQRLADTIGQQQTIGQLGQRIVMGQLRQLLLGALDGRDVGKHRDKMPGLPVFALDATDGLPLRIDLAAFASVPDLATPLPGTLQ